MMKYCSSLDSHLMISMCSHTSPSIVLSVTINHALSTIHVYFVTLFTFSQLTLLSILKEFSFFSYESTFSSDDYVINIY